MNATAERLSNEEPGLRTLAFGVAAGPAPWFLLLCANYSLVRFACLSGQTWILHVLNLAALLLALAGGWIAWHNWQRSGRPREATEGGQIGRTRFLAVAGLVTSAFFTLMVITTWIPNLFLNPCLSP